MAEETNKFGRLKVFQHSTEGRCTKLQLWNNNMTIGTDLKATVRLVRPNVEPIHCELLVREDGLVTLINRSKQNPVLINEQIVWHQRCLLPNDIFSIVGKIFLYENPILPAEIIKEATRTNLETLKKMKRITIVGAFTPQPSKTYVPRSRRSNSLGDLGTSQESNEPSNKKLANEPGICKVNRSETYSRSHSKPNIRLINGFVVSTLDSTTKPSTHNAETCDLSEMNISSSENDESSSDAYPRELLKTPIADTSNLVSDELISTPFNNTSTIVVPSSQEEETPLRSRKSKVKDISVQRLTNNDDSVIVLDSPSSKTPKSALKRKFSDTSMSPVKGKLLDLTDNEGEEEEESSIIEIDNSSVSQWNRTEDTSDDSKLESVKENVRPSRNSERPGRKAFEEEAKRDSDVPTNIGDNSSFIVEPATPVASLKKVHCSTPGQNVDKDVSFKDTDNDDTKASSPCEETDTTDESDLGIGEKRKRESNTPIEILKKRQKLVSNDSTLPEMNSFASEDNGDSTLNSLANIEDDVHLMKTPVTQPDLSKRNAFTEPKAQKAISKRRSLSLRSSKQENEILTESNNTTVETIDTSSFIYVKNNISFECAQFGSPSVDAVVEKLQKEPLNDLSDVTGVKQLMKTPRIQKEPVNDLSSPRGLRQLMKTPKCQTGIKNDLTDVSGVKDLMKTPAAAKDSESDANHSDEGGMSALDISGVDTLNDDEDVFPMRKVTRTYGKSLPSTSKTVKTFRRTDVYKLEVNPEVAKWVEENTSSSSTVHDFANEESVIDDAINTTETALDQFEDIEKCDEDDQLGVSVLAELVEPDQEEKLPIKNSRKSKRHTVGTQNNSEIVDNGESTPATRKSMRKASAASEISSEKLSRKSVRKSSTLIENAMQAEQSDSENEYVNVANLNQAQTKRKSMRKSVSNEQTSKEIAKNSCHEAVSGFCDENNSSDNKLPFEEPSLTENVVGNSSPDELERNTDFTESENEGEIMSTEVDEYPIRSARRSMRKSAVIKNNSDNELQESPVKSDAITISDADVDDSKDAASTVSFKETFCETSDIENTEVDQSEILQFSEFETVDDQVSCEPTLQNLPNNDSATVPKLSRKSVGFAMDLIGSDDEVEIETSMEAAEVDSIESPEDQDLTETDNIISPKSVAQETLENTIVEIETTEDNLRKSPRKSMRKSVVLDEDENDIKVHENAAVVDIGVVSVGRKSMRKSHALNISIAEAPRKSVRKSVLSAMILEPQEINSEVERDSFKKSSSNDDDNAINAIIESADSTEEFDNLAKSIRKSVVNNDQYDIAAAEEHAIVESPSSERKSMRKSNIKVISDQESKPSRKSIRKSVVPTTDQIESDKFEDAPTQSSRKSLRKSKISSDILFTLEESIPKGEAEYINENLIKADKDNSMTLENPTTASVEVEIKTPSSGRKSTSKTLTVDSTKQSDNLLQSPRKSMRKSVVLNYDKSVIEELDDSLPVYNRLASGRTSVRKSKILKMASGADVSAKPPRVSQTNKTSNNTAAPDDKYDSNEEFDKSMRKSSAEDLFELEESLISCDLNDSNENADTDNNLSSLQVDDEVADIPIVEESLPSAQKSTKKSAKLSRKSSELSANKTIAAHDDVADVSVNSSRKSNRKLKISEKEFDTIEQHDKSRSMSTRTSLDSTQNLVELQESLSSCDLNDSRDNENMTETDNDPMASTNKSTIANVTMESAEGETETTYSGRKSTKKTSSVDSIEESNNLLISPRKSMRTSVAPDNNESGLEIDEDFTDAPMVEENLVTGRKSNISNAASSRKSLQILEVPLNAKSPRKSLRKIELTTIDYIEEDKNLVGTDAQIGISLRKSMRKSSVNTAHSIEVDADAMTKFSRKSLRKSKGGSADSTEQLQEFTTSFMKSNIPQVVDMAQEKSSANSLESQETKEHKSLRKSNASIDIDGKSMRKSAFPIVLIESSDNISYLTQQSFNESSRKSLRKSNDTKDSIQKNDNSTKSSSKLLKRSNAIHQDSVESPDNNKRLNSGPQSLRKSKVNKDGIDMDKEISSSRKSLNLAKLSADDLTQNEIESHDQEGTSSGRKSTRKSTIITENDDGLTTSPDKTILKSKLPTTKTDENIDKPVRKSMRKSINTIENIDEKTKTPHKALQKSASTDSNQFSNDEEPTYLGRRSLKKSKVTEDSGLGNEDVLTPPYNSAKTNDNIGNSTATPEDTDENVKTPRKALRKSKDPALKDTIQSEEYKRKSLRRSKVDIEDCLERENTASMPVCKSIRRSSVISSIDSTELQDDGASSDRKSLPISSKSREGDLNESGTSKRRGVVNIPNQDKHEPITSPRKYLRKSKTDDLALIPTTQTFITPVKATQSKEDHLFKTPKVDDHTPSQLSTKTGKKVKIPSITITSSTPGSSTKANRLSDLNLSITDGNLTDNEDTAPNLERLEIRKSKRSSERKEVDTTMTEHDHSHHNTRLRKRANTNTEENQSTKSTRSRTRRNTDTEHEEHDTIKRSQRLRQRGDSEAEQEKNLENIPKATRSRRRVNTDAEVSEENPDELETNKTNEIVPDSNINTNKNKTKGTKSRRGQKSVDTDAEEVSQEEPKTSMKRSRRGKKEQPVDVIDLTDNNDEELLTPIKVTKTRRGQNSIQKVSEDEETTKPTARARANTKEESVEVKRSTRSRKGKAATVSAQEDSAKQVAKKITRNHKSSEKNEEGDQADTPNPTPMEKKSSRSRKGKHTEEIEEANQEDQEGDQVEDTPKKDRRIRDTKEESVEVKKPKRETRRGKIQEKTEENPELVVKKSTRSKGKTTEEDEVVNLVDEEVNLVDEEQEPQTALRRRGPKREVPDVKKSTRGRKAKANLEVKEPAVEEKTNVHEDCFEPVDITSADVANETNLKEIESKVKTTRSRKGKAVVIEETVEENQSPVKIGTRSRKTKKDTEVVTEAPERSDQHEPQSSVPKRRRNAKNESESATSKSKPRNKIADATDEVIEEFVTQKTRKGVTNITCKKVAFTTPTFVSLTPNVRKTKRRLKSEDELNMEAMEPARKTRSRK